MFGVYLFSAILGGGLVLFSLLGGADHDAGMGDDMDVGGHDGPNGHGASGSSLILGIFRLRNMTFLLTAFGVTGLLGSGLKVPSGTTAAMATVMGVSAMLLVHGVFRWLRRTDSAADVLADSDLEGSFARVVVPVSPGGLGRVSCIASGQQIFLTARLAAEAREGLPVGVPVVILRMAGGVAEVSPAPSLELSSSPD